jgi:hypothetical protein
VKPKGVEPTQAIVSYFNLQRQDQSITGLGTYGAVIYEELWPGIDLIYTVKAARLKYTFLVKPGADPTNIKLS